MANVVKKVGIKRAKGFIYFINKDGSIGRFNLKSKKKEVVKKTGITKEKGYLYFLDKNGDVSRSKMKRR